MNQATMSRRLEGLKALGFNSEAEYQQHRKLMEDSKRLAAQTKAASIAAGSTAFSPPKPKLMTNADGNAIMVLTGKQMGLKLCMSEYAERFLGGETLHVVAHAAIEKEAVGVNEQLRHDAALIAQANSIADRMKAAFGFA